MSQGSASFNILSNAVSVADTASRDAFSRLRISSPTALFSSQCQYDADPLQYETGATGTGSSGVHSANTRMVALACTAGSGTSFIQSYEYVPYQPGKSQLVQMTGLFGAGVAATTVDVGIFDASNGIFVRQNGVSGLQIFSRTSTSGGVVNNAVSQASWNLDPLNGTGPSGLTISESAVFILIIDAQYLGMGRVRVGFDIGGSVVYVHQFLSANVIAVPYMQSLTLPVQMLVTAVVSGSTKTAYFKCAAVSSEGGLEADLRYEFSTPEQTVAAASATRTHIISLRPLTTFNSITNRSKTVLLSVDVCVTGTNPVLWELCVGSTFSAGPTFASVNATYSATQYTSAVGTLSAAGLVVAAGYVAASASTNMAISLRQSHRYPITLDRAGAVRANGTFSLLVTGLGGSSASRAILNFAEIR